MTQSRFITSLATAVVAAAHASCATTPIMDFSEPADDLFRPRPSEAGHSAVILRADRLIALEGTRTYVQEIREVLILRPEALMLANLLWPLPRDAEYPEVWGRTLPAPSADPIPLTSGFVQDFDWVRQSELDDGLLSRGIMAAFPEVGVGSVIQVFLSYRLPYPSIYGNWGLGPTLPTRRARLTIRLPSRINVEWRATGLDVDVKDGELLDTLTAEIRNYVPETTYEPFGTEISTPHIQWVARSATGPYGRRIGIYDSWSKVAELFRLGIEERLANANPVTTPKLREREPSNRVEVVFELVQDGLRDETRPWAGRSRNPPGQVLARAQGTSDERAFLMYAILRETGLDARLGVVMPPREADPDVANHGGWSRFVDPGVLQGEYIVVVNGSELEPEKIYLDPACRRCSAGELALEHAGRDLAVFDPAASTNEVEWITLPEVELEDVGTQAHYRVTPEGLVAREWTQMLDPVRSRSLRQWLWEQPADPDESESHFRQTLGVPWGGEFSIDAAREPGQPIEVELRDVDFFHSELAFSDEAIALPVVAFADTDWMDALLSSSNPRLTDVFLGTAGRYHTSVTLSAPDGYRVDRVPEDLSIEQEGAIFVREVVVNEDETVRIDITANVSPRWPAEQFGELRDFVARARRSCDEEVRWRKSPRPDDRLDLTNARSEAPRGT